MASPADPDVVREDWAVRVPASSANLGPAFDALAVALSRWLVVRPARPGEEPAAPTHPAVTAFAATGGTGPITVGASFPGGRGLGFSGAARVAGILGARVQRGLDPDDRDVVVESAARMEGHADNVAASVTGGVVAVAGRRIVRVELGREVAVVVWIPGDETATASSRLMLPDSVGFGDAVFNVGRTALLVAALAAGDVDALRVATEDRLHQDRRLARVPASRAALAAALDAGAWGAWLSGSGPSVAAFADPARAHDIARALPSAGRTEVLAVDVQGASVEQQGNVDDGPADGPWRAPSEEEQTA